MKEFWKRFLPPPLEERISPILIIISPSWPSTYYMCRDGQHHFAWSHGQKADARDARFSFYQNQMPRRFPNELIITAAALTFSSSHSGQAIVSNEWHIMCGPSLSARRPDSKTQCWLTGGAEFDRNKVTSTLEFLRAAPWVHGVTRRSRNTAASCGLLIVLSPLACICTHVSP